MIVIFVKDVFVHLRLDDFLTDECLCIYNEAMLTSFIFVRPSYDYYNFVAFTHMIMLVIS